MNRSKRLQPVIQVAQLKARQGLQAIAYMQKRLGEEQDKLAALRACRDDYASDNERENRTMNACFLKSFREFSQSLEVALVQQSTQVGTVQAQLHEVQGMWRKLDGRSRTLQKTQGRFAAEERLLESKQEQKYLDEFVSQQAARAAAVRSHQ
ncbi:MAG: flagellar FliJ protein [Pseudohongiellaceae bacterium]|jgi:flagellar FliJ protein